MAKQKRNRFFHPANVALLCATVDWEVAATRIDAIDAPQLVAGALEDVQSQAVAHLYPELMARSVIPPHEGVDEGADTVIWHEYDSAGMANIIENYSNDLPFVGLAISENTSPIRTIGAAYSFSTEDLRRVVFARANGRQASLGVDKAQETDKFIERKIDDLAIKGDAVHGIPGLMRNGNVTTISAAAAAAGANAPEWDGADKVAQEIYDDMVNLVSTLRTTSKGVHRANVMAMDVDRYDKIKTTLFLTSTDNPMSILEVFERQHPEVRVVEWPALEEGLTGDAAGIVVMDTGPLNVGLVIPMESRPQPPQPKNLSFVVPVEAKTGGVIIKRPLAVLYMDDV